ncbi:MAG TPA: hypothetical protein DEG71_04325 [Clostridiales bacterium]|nr:hypothetical protein [Clostridiales bacterium]
MSDIQSKNLDNAEKDKIESSVKLNKNAIRKYNALIIDDIYGTGKTLNEVVKVLKSDGMLEKVYVLVMTKRKR